MTHDDTASAQEAYEVSCEALEFAKRVFREWGEGVRISTAERGNTDAPLHAHGRSSITGGSPAPLTIIRAELAQLQERAERERWGYPAEAAPEMAKLVLRLYVTEAR